jgi:hypothetical protein
MAVGRALQRGEPVIYASHPVSMLSETAVNHSGVAQR